MSTTATKDDIRALNERLDKQFTKIDYRFDQVDQQFTKIDGRFEQVDKQFIDVDKRFDELMAVMSRFADDTQARFAEIERRLDEHDAKFDRLLNTIDSFIARIDTYETELAARDHKIARLERYIEVLAEKTGVDLTTIKV